MEKWNHSVQLIVQYFWSKYLENYPIFQQIVFGEVECSWITTFKHSEIPPDISQWIFPQITIRITFRESARHSFQDFSINSYRYSTQDSLKYSSREKFQEFLSSFLLGHFLKLFQSFFLRIAGMYPRFLRHSVRNSTWITFRGFSRILELFLEFLRVKIQDSFLENFRSSSRDSFILSSRNSLTDLSQGSSCGPSRGSVVRIPQLFLLRFFRDS